jgi:serine/threonine protein kinase
LENNITAKVDIWALGITCIELAEGTTSICRQSSHELFIYFGDRFNEFSSLIFPRKKIFLLNFLILFRKCLTVSIEERPTAEELLKVILFVYFYLI